ncbi:E3 ubiquitin-protein ligase RBBP6 isoform X2, partial [Sigmodon hispidus]
MSCVHYKFSSQLNYKTIIFDGLHISLSDLKKQIMGKEKLRAALSDLQITNAQTKEEFTDGSALIHRNSSVIVRRIPPGTVKFTRKTDYGVSGTEPAEMETANAPICLAQLRKTANLAEANASEEEKIKAMMFQSSRVYHPVNDRKKPLGLTPPSYSCVCCGKPGHSSQNCPRNVEKQQKKFDSGPRIRRSTGIPTSFLMEVEDPNRKGAMLTNRGTYAIPMVSAEAYAIRKREKPPFLAEEQSSCSEKGDRIPEEHLCPICKDIMTDAAVIPCCQNSYCDECIRTALLESDDHTCPTCHQHDVSPDALVANKNLRRAIENFQSQSGPRRRLGKQLLPPPLPISPQRPLVQRNLQPLTRSPISRQQNPLMAPVTSTSAPAVGPDSTVTASPAEHREKAHGPLRDAEKQLLPGAALTSKGSGAT